nr:hypothetical protein [Tanacetum cinerariifolium]
MRTRSSSILTGESSPNPTSLNPKCRNRRCSKQPFILEESPVDTMADQCTMAELLRAPTEGYVEAIVVPPILAEQYELKHSLINMMTSDQFFGLEKDKPHDHIRWGSSSLAQKRTIAFYSHLGGSYFHVHQRILSPSRTTNLRNEISNFQQRFDESFHEAWDRYKELLHSLNSAVGGNLLERRTQDVLTIIKNKSKVRNSRNKSIVSQVKSSDANYSSSSKIAKLTHAVNQQTSAVTIAMTAILKQFQVTPPPAFVKAVEEICVTCGGAHPYNQFVPLSELEKIKKMNEINMKAMQTQINNVKNELRNEMKTSIQASMSNQTNEHKNKMASFFQMNTASTSGSGPLPSNTIANPKGKMKAITTRSGIVLDGPSIPMPSPFINPEEDDRVEDTLTNQDLTEKKLGLPEIISTRMTLELANRAICTPAGIARDVFVLVGKFIFPADFFIVDYENDPRFPLILGRPFLQTAHALIDVHGKEMILYDSCEDFLEDLFAINHLSGNLTFSSHLDLTSPKVKDDIFDQEGDNVLIEKLLNLDSTKDLPPPHKINPLSGSTTSFSSPNHLLKKFADELALITFPPRNDDLPFDIESDLKEIEYLLNHDPIKEMDSILEDSIDECNLSDSNDNLVDTIPEVFTDEHAFDYSSPPLYDDYNDDLDEFESSDFLPSPKYDSFLFEDFSEVYALPSTNNKDKVFNPGILIQENLYEDTVQARPDKNVKKIFISHASLILEDFDPPLYELPFHKEVPRSETLLSFSSKNEEEVFKLRILTSKGVHSSLLLELSHRGPKVFKVIKIL